MIESKSSFATLGVIGLRTGSGTVCFFPVNFEMTGPGVTLMEQIFVLAPFVSKKFSSDVSTLMNFFLAM
jgi:hypothetical protein